jgi:hypothetical protein
MALTFFGRFESPRCKEDSQVNSVSVSIDHFGVASNPAVQTLLNQSSNNKARRSALHNLFRMAKASGVTPRNAEPAGVAVFVNQAGGQLLQFLYFLPEKTS